MPVAECPMRNHPDIQKHMRYLEEDQIAPGCCRHPEHHLIGAYATPKWRDDPQSKGSPDVYILFCTCGRLHRRVMMGSGVRPGWNRR
jgi:hypothetical protein